MCMTGRTDSDGVTKVSWGWLEWIGATVVTVLTLISLFGSIYVTRQDAQRDERIKTLETRSERWDKAATSLDGIKPLIERIDERTLYIQHDLQQLKGAKP